MWQKIDGKKTKIVSLILLLVSTYMGLDVIFDDTLPDLPKWVLTGLDWLKDNWALGVLSASGLYSVRDAIRKLEK